MTYHVAVLGATGCVGREVLNTLLARKFPCASLTALASSRSAGTEITLSDGRTFNVQDVESFDFKGTDFAFFAVEAAISERYAQRVIDTGGTVIDKSAHFRLDPFVPLMVPEINGEVLEELSFGLISVPNCVAIPLALALHPLLKLAPFKRIVVDTYQSVSGAGQEGMNALSNQSRALENNEVPQPEHFSKQIAFNLIPHIGPFSEDGSTDEEEKIRLETRKILDLPLLNMAVTCVRVPVFIGHCMAVHVEFEGPVSREEARSAFQKAPGLEVRENSTPLDVQGGDLVHVSRLRQDASVPFGLSFWVACDNLRKGAALNGVQIAEAIIADVRCQISDVRRRQEPSARVLTSDIRHLTSGA